MCISWFAWMKIQDYWEERSRGCRNFWANSLCYMFESWLVWAEVNTFTTCHWSQKKTEWLRFPLWSLHQIFYRHSTGNTWDKAFPVRRNSNKSLGAPWKNIFSHRMTTCQQLRNISYCWTKRKRLSDAYFSSCSKAPTIIHLVTRPFTKQRPHAIDICIEIPP